MTLSSLHWVVNWPVFTINNVNKKQTNEQKSSEPRLSKTQVHIPNGIMIGSASFAQLTADSPYTLQWAAPFPSKLTRRRRMGHLDPI